MFTKIKLQLKNIRIRNNLYKFFSSDTNMYNNNLNRTNLFLEYVNQYNKQSKRNIETCVHRKWCNYDNKVITYLIKKNRNIESNNMMTKNPNYIFKDNEFKSVINWALNPREYGLIWKPTKEEKTKLKLLKLSCSKLREKAKMEEKLWGNKLINQDGNVNWTTKLGEGLVHDVLVKMGENPRKTLKNGCCPDWETDNCVYEVKTRNWTTTGTAGEKVLGTMYKYSDVPKIFNKPLKIICVGYEEWELTHGKDNIRIFKNISQSKEAFIKLAKDLNIEYIPFSQFVKTINC
jgi:hypothetical protein